MKKYRNKYLYIYADIFFTKGYTRTMICDLKRNVWQFIPNEFYDVILLFKEMTIETIVEKQPVLENEIFDFIDFLLTHDYGVLVDDISVFPDIQKNWHSPHYIENAIIDIGSASCHNYDKISIELQKLLCRNIQFRCYTELTIVEVNTIVQYFMNKDFSSIDFLLKYNPLIATNDYLLLAKDNPSLSFVIHSAPENVFHDSLLKEKYPIVGYVQYIKQKIDSANCCGIINKHSFVYPKLPRDFIEGIVRNKCLNAKISIDILGEIKNCPSMVHSYGNIKEKSLLEIVNNKSFRKYWTITKDSIDTCNLCEYRYVCNDCRAFANTKYGKPEKCAYNPLTAQWEK